MKVVLGTCFWMLFGLRVEGREHEPPSGPVLAICNHVSALDPPIAGVVLRRRARFMAKEELLQVPVLGVLLRAIGVFPVRRGEPDRQSIRTALEALLRGDLLLMFPEGTRSADGRLRAAEPGAALLALRTGAAVLPMAVIGTHRVMPKGARLPRPRPVVVRLGPPLSVPRQEGRLDRTLLEAWGQRFMAAIAALLPPDQRPRLSGQTDTSISPEGPER
jgi:1-acyl-sn-glycerol-3-phosphate acyltransferase